MNIDDGDIFIGEFANGAIGSIQTSFVTVGNYPGIEARLYGEQGRDHLPAGRGVRRGRDDQGRDAGRRRVQASSRSRSASIRPAGIPRESWRSLFYANLISDFIDEILEGGDAQPGQLRRRRLGAGSRSTPSSGRSTSGAGSICRWSSVTACRARLPRRSSAAPSAPGSTTSSPRTTGIARSTRPSSACTPTTTRLPDFSEHGARRRAGRRRVAPPAGCSALPDETAERGSRRSTATLAEGFLRIQHWEFGSGPLPARQPVASTPARRSLA